MAHNRKLRQGWRVGDGQRVQGPAEAQDYDQAQRRLTSSPGLGTRGARTRSHVHGQRHGRFLVHLLVVTLSISAIVFASQYPTSGSAVEPVVPTLAYSGVAGAMRLSDGDSYLRATTSLQTHESVAAKLRSSEVANVRAVGGVAPTASISSGVSAAAATSGVQGGGITGLAELVDPSKPYDLYVTRPGDSISRIAGEYGVSMATILDNNPTLVDSNLIPLGLELVVPLTDGILHKVAFGETLSDIVGQYDNITLDTARGFRPNAINDPDSLEPGSFVMLPGATVKPPPPPPPAPAPVAAPVSPGGGGGGLDIPAPPSSGGRFSNPLGAYLTVSDEFGTYRGGSSYHTGIDLDLYGYWSSPIYSACNGTVVRTEWLTYSYGYYVVVDCGDGWTTLYAHMSQIDVSVGQQVFQGSMLGLSGVTGFTTGEHLHFEIRYFGAPVNPAEYIAF